MRLVGTCPHCEARLELAAPPPPLLTCGTCGGRCMVLMPEEGGEGSADEVEVAVLRLKEELAPPSPLASRGLRRPILFGLIAACALAVAFLFVGLLYGLAPGSSLTKRAIEVFAFAAGLLLVGLPLIAALSLLVVWFLFGRKGRSLTGFDLRRSVLAVTAGVMTLEVAQRLIFWLRSWMVAGPLPLSLVPLFTKDVLVALMAGWITVKLAPTAPYRHAIAVGLVIVLGLLFLVLPFSVRTPGLVLGSAAYLVSVPVLLAGAWLGMRFGSGREKHRAA